MVRREPHREDRSNRGSPVAVDHESGSKVKRETECDVLVMWLYAEFFS